MMEFISRYSGLCAIVVYSLILWIILAISSRRKRAKAEPVRTPQPTATNAGRLDENDEDAVVAALVAAIEGRNEWHKDVRIVSIREV